MPEKYHSWIALRSIRATLSTPSIAARGHAAVDHDLGPGDKARLVGGQEQHRMRSVAAVAHEAERNARDARFQQSFDVAAGALFGKPRLDHRRVHLARYHRVHADAFAGILHGGDTRELDHGR